MESCTQQTRQKHQNQRQQRLNVSLEKVEMVGTDGKLVKFSKRDDERYGMTCKAKDVHATEPSKHGTYKKGLIGSVHVL